MKATRGTAGRIFSALAHARVNVKMIDQGSSELNIIIGVKNADFEAGHQGDLRYLYLNRNLINGIPIYSNEKPVRTEA